MNPLLIIPARAGSKGIPGKNLRTVGGISLLGHAILAAQQFQNSIEPASCQIHVDTDSEELAEHARRWGVHTPFLRPAHLAQDNTPTVDNVLFTLQELRKRGSTNDCVILLQPTSPLRTAADIAQGYSLFRRSGAPLVASLVRNTHPPQLSVNLNDSGNVQWAFSPPPPNARRQDLALTFRPNGAVYIATSDHLHTRRNFFDPTTMLGYEMPEERSVDIDSPTDLALAEALLSLTPAPTAPGDKLPDALPGIVARTTSASEAAIAALKHLHGLGLRSIVAPTDVLAALRASSLPNGITLYEETHLAVTVSPSGGETEDAARSSQPVNAGDIAFAPTDACDPPAIWRVLQAREKKSRLFATVMSLPTHTDVVSRAAEAASISRSLSSPVGIAVADTRAITVALASDAPFVVADLIPLAAMYGFSTG